jgi:hypothetical protein
MKCRICGHDKEESFFNAAEMMFGLKEVFSYFKCAKCGCLQITQIPENIDRFYPAKYYSYSLGHALTVKNPVLKAIRKLRDMYAVFGRNHIGACLYRFFPNEKL